MHLGTYIRVRAIVLRVLLVFRYVRLVFQFHVYVDLFASRGPLKFRLAVARV